MSGWPSLDRSEDQRLAEALAAGDLDALAQVFDAYAARLYDYCHALLRDQDAASAALHDTLLAACAHAGGLTEPERLRAWLYALVRNECLRRLHASDAHGNPPPPGMVVDPYTGESRPPRQAPEVQDAFLDESDRARRMELRRLVHGALSGLGGRRREALDLLLRHALSSDEVAGVLGLNESEAAELAVEARGRLDEALLVSIIAQARRCPEVSALMEGQQWPPEPAVAREVGRHLDDGCPVCAEQRERRVATGRLLQVLPVALLPADLRGAVLDSATAPEYAETRAAIAEQAEPFDEWGWPVPVGRSAYRPTRGAGGRQGPRLLPAVAAAVLVVLVVGAAFLWLPGGSGTPAASGSSAKVTASGDDPSPSTTQESPSPDDSPSPTVSVPTVTPSSARPDSPSPTRSASRSPSAPGTLAVGGCSIPAGASSCTITVSARGGPVRWSVVGRSGVVAVGGGILSTGRSATVRATRLGRCTESGSGSVSFSPNGTASVTWTCPPPDDPGPEDPGEPEEPGVPPGPRG
ncbi:RNA polymerase sigma factor, sigma-70 family [Thermomonospora echinospora]|uniref:RNA polymerase sigma factor, sigma-70 family n=1 Tax=Thermomonospora echinospora TaxID=1992 RepID=A0A1H6B9C0_9ACTN|nr:sigma-70 family RNA polymerase sigma factor [Thermomonospora echinospora]SEG56766.1 RNA polymerase sigma factor, sigma-70 family [Thermomonospora echinospora]